MIFSRLGSDPSASIATRSSLVHDPSGQCTHALIPHADYIQLLAAEMAERGIEKLDNPNYEWIPFEDVLTEFAAPKIAAAREKKGLTQKQLGAKLGMPQSQVSRMEKNPASVTYRTLQRVAKALGVKINDMLA